MVGRLVATGTSLDVGRAKRVADPSLEARAGTYPTHRYYSCATGRGAAWLAR
jgi:hypothetical protein